MCVWADGLKVFVVADWWNEEIVLVTTSEDEARSAAERWGTSTVEVHEKQLEPPYSKVKIMETQ